MKAHCDTKLKKAKAASGILMIRQNSFHEILSLLSILILIPPSPVKQQHLCQPVYLFLHLPASDPIIWLLSVCLSLCFCAAHTTFWPLRRGSTRKQEWKFQIGSRDWTGKVGKGGKVGSGCYGPNLFATFIPKLSQPTDNFFHSVS